MEKQNNMSQLALITEILKDDYFPNNQDIMEEENIMARKILKHKGYKYLLFRFDPNKEKPFPYFKDVSGLCKICDYILFVETGESFYILLVELKQGKGTTTKQLEASEIFAQFVINSGIRVGFPFTNDICYKKVKISESTGKPKTTVRNLVIDNGIIHYKHKTEFNIWDIIDATSE